MKKGYLIMLCISVFVLTFIGCSNKDSDTIIEEVKENQDSTIVEEDKASKTDSATSAEQILDDSTSISEYVNGNLVNDSLITKQGDWLYYSLEDGIYKINIDGTEEQKLCDNSGISIIVANDWVYFKSQGVYRVKTDGTELEQISDIAKAGTFHIVDDKIYYCLEYKMDLDGSSCEQIYDKNAASGYTINVVDGWIYFFDRDLNDKGHIYKMKTDGSDLQSIFDGKVDYMIVYGEWIYFQNYKENRALYKMKKDGSDLQLILNQEISALNVVDDWIYYAEWGDNKGLCKIKIDGTENQMLCSDNATRIHIIDDYIYYRINGDRTKSLYQIKTDGSERKVFYEGGPN